MIKIVADEEELYRSVADCAFDTLGLSGDATVELVLINEEEIRQLNLETRGIDKSTDVLSYPNLTQMLPFTKQNYPFDFDDESNSVFLGSIAICENIAAMQADEYGHALNREKAYLFLHGLLHLLGYDHIDEDDKKVMRSREEEILTALGVTR